MAICDIQNRDDTLSVDAFLTKSNPCTRRGGASFTADLEICNAQGNMEIQIEGLTVASWDVQRPENDYELYLTTAFDLDPEDEIVSPELPDKHSPSPMLIESCERLASHFYTDLPWARKLYLGYMGIPSLDGYTISSVPLNPWPTETDESLDAFVRKSPYYPALNFLRLLGGQLSDFLPGLLPAVIMEAHQVFGFQQHVSRVVRQIAHKYPRMNVLGLTHPDAGLSEHVLAGLEKSFSSFRIGGHVERNLEERVTDLQRGLGSKVIVDEVDLDSEIHDSTTGVPYDLVLLSTSLLKGGTCHKTLSKIRQAMRSGGFLILVHISRASFRDRMQRCVHDGARLPELVDTPSTVVTSREWAAILDECDFVAAANNSTQECYPGFSLMVWQAGCQKKQMILHPLSHLAAMPRLSERLLVIGGKRPWTSAVATKLRAFLYPYCGTVTVIEALEYVSDDFLASFSAVILLSDFDEPILATMTKSRMDGLRALFRPEMVLLWVTRNARLRNPDHATSFGFARTLVAETPGLTLQMLDLDVLDTPSAVNQISEVFARVTAERIAEASPGSSPLWVHEPEIHIENGRRVVPRVVPWKAGNDRVNAGRRVMTNVANTLESLVELMPVPSEDGTITHLSKIHPVGVEALERPMRVDYSTAGELRLGQAYSTYVCSGHDILTNTVRVALSDSNVSYIGPPLLSCVIDVPPAIARNQPLFLALVVRYLAALDMADIVHGKAVMLVEPDPILEECAKDIFVGRGVPHQVYSTDEARCNSTPGLVFIHPRSTTRQIKALYPPGGAWLFNFLPASSKISGMLAETCANGCHYSASDALPNLGYPSREDSRRFMESVWTEAVRLSLQKALNWNTVYLPHTISVPSLLERTDPAQPFEILNWRAERWISHTIQPSVGSDMLSPERTYVLVGITRDFGQSLCTLFVQQGARHIVLASRSPPARPPKWQEELLRSGIRIHFEALDVTSPEQVLEFKAKLKESFPPVGGIVNGAMVLDDGIFSQMSAETFHRVMAPKVIGSRNLDEAFAVDDLEFFIMTSSFAAIGGHPGQSNYAAANMYMNGLAASRRARGQAGSVLNIGVIYGLGFLHREKDELYDGLEREGYPPISERDIHHMFLEAIVAGKPVPGQVADITTGLRRFPADRPSLFWHHDPRFSHFSYIDDESQSGTLAGESKNSVKELLGAADTKEDVLSLVSAALIGQIEQIMQIPEGRIVGEDTIRLLGVDSLQALELHHWIWENLTVEVAAMKILEDATTVAKCKSCLPEPSMNQEARLTHRSVPRYSQPLHGAPADRSQDGGDHRPRHAGGGGSCRQLL